MTAPATSPTGLLPARAEYELIASPTATPSKERDSSRVRIISFLLLTSPLMSYYRTSCPARCYGHPPTGEWNAIIFLTMRILAVDMGTGTQDILLFDSAQPVEHALQMIMPSATEIAAGRIRRATREV